MAQYSTIPARQFSFLISLTRSSLRDIIMGDSANITNGFLIENIIESTKSKLKKIAQQKAKTSKPKSTHPRTSDMVIAAIKELKDRKGSSFQAIRKYVVATYKVDGEKITPFIKKYLKNAVSSGTVVQTTGKGASGSFKLSTVKSGSTKAKAQRVIKEKKTTDKSVEKKTMAARETATSAATKKTKTSSEKTESVKKPTVRKKPKVATSKAATAVATTAPVAITKKKITKKAAKPKTLSKTETVKAAATKTKTPKPKKVKTKTVRKNSKISVNKQICL
ncbi:hypothetical protein HZH66_000148 [Vespula vulgaris]|uniref:H15 domain-containing protein n=2 Tax=Vespula vulgaris TaxID=7454 RepID=A0A834KSL2_VESVU|nr:hypothetical protein HZH66_000148 [Vespula vulgaris]